MKTTFSVPAAALVAGLLATSTPVLRADDPPTVTNAPPKIELSLSAPAIAPAADEPLAGPTADPSVATPGQPQEALAISPATAEAVPAEAGITPTESEPLVVAVRLDTATTPLTTQPQADVQRRLEPPKPEALIAKFGTAGFLIRQPEGRNFLDVINPFAPSSFGPQPREVYSRNPNLKPGASLPRTFVSDGIKNEPEVNLFSWPW